MKRSFLLITLALGVIAPKFASASDQLFMQIAGIPGSSLQQSHVGWIELLSFSGTAAPPAASTSKKQPPEACQLTVLKQLDIAGPRLWAATVTGQTFPTIEIQVVLAGGDLNNYLIYDVLLTNAQVTAISESGAAGSGLPVESVSLKAANVTLTFTPQNADGTRGTPVSSSFACD
jgi:type VI secretion system Hcp family effector